MNLISNKGLPQNVITTIMQPSREQHNKCIELYVVDDAWLQFELGSSVPCPRRPRWLINTTLLPGVEFLTRQPEESPVNPKPSGSN